MNVQIGGHISEVVAGQIAGRTWNVRRLPDGFLEFEEVEWTMSEAPVEAVPATPSTTEETPVSSEATVPESEATTTTE